MRSLIKLGSKDPTYYYKYICKYCTIDKYKTMSTEEVCAHVLKYMGDHYPEQVLFAKCVDYHTDCEQYVDEYDLDQFPFPQSLPVYSKLDSLYIQ